MNQTQPPLTHECLTPVITAHSLPDQVHMVSHRVPFPIWPDSSIKCPDNQIHHNIRHTAASSTIDGTAQLQYLTALKGPDWIAQMQSRARSEGIDWMAQLQYLTDSTRIDWRDLLRFAARNDPGDADDVSGGHFRLSSHTYRCSQAYPS